MATQKEKLKKLKEIKQQLVEIEETNSDERIEILHYILESAMDDIGMSILDLIPYLLEFASKQGEKKGKEKLLKQISRL